MTIPEARAATPIPSTPETRRRGFIERAREIMADPTSCAIPGIRAAAAVALGPEARLEDLGAALNWSTMVRCLQCRAAVARAVTVGEEPDRESKTTTLCRPCLVAALAALDGAP